MDFRAQRQLAVLFIIAVVIFGFGFLAYQTVKPAATCEDHAKNQGEEEADCGGPCISCAFRHRQPIAIFWQTFVQTRPNTYDAAAEIRNPNVKLAARSFEYEFRLYDENGFAVDRRSGKAFIYPGETMHLAAVGLNSNHRIERVELAIQDPFWVLADAIEPDVVAGNRDYRIEDDDGPRSVLSAQIANRTTEDVSGVSVLALLFDARGNFAGVQGTVLDRIPAKEAKAVRWAWPNALPEAPSSITVEVRSPQNLPAEQ